MKREKALAVNTIMLGIGYVVPFVVNMLFLPVYTSKLSQEEYGIYDLISVISSILITLTTLQIMQAGMRYLMEYRNSDTEEENKRVITNVLTFVFASTALLFVIILFVLKGMPVRTRILVTVYFVVQVHVETLKALVRGQGKNKGYVISVVVQSLVSFIFILTFFNVCGTGLDILLLANVIALIMTEIYLGWKSSIGKYYSFSYLSLSYIGSLLKLSVPITFSAIGTWVIKWSDRVVLTLFLGVAANGIYAIANKIPNLLSQVFEVFNFSWQENVTITVHDQDSDMYYSQVFKIMFSVLAGMAYIMAGIIPFLFKLLIDDSYGDAYNQIPILIAAYFFTCLDGYFGNIFFALKKLKVNAYTSIIGAIANFVVCVAFINKIGIYAASVSSLVGYMLSAFIKFFTVLKWKRMSYDYLSISVEIALLFVICCICYVENTTVIIVNAMASILIAAYINRNILKEMVRIFISWIERRNRL